MTDMQVKSGMVHVYRLKWITSLLKGGVLLVFVVIAALYLFGFNKKTQVKKLGSRYTIPEIFALDKRRKRNDSCILMSAARSAHCSQIDRLYEDWTIYYAWNINHLSSTHPAPHNEIRCTTLCFKVRENDGETRERSECVMVKKKSLSEIYVTLLKNGCQTILLNPTAVELDLAHTLLKLGRFDDFVQVSSQTDVFIDQGFQTKVSFSQCKGLQIGLHAQVESERRMDSETLASRFVLSPAVFATFSRRGVYVLKKAFWILPMLHWRGGYWDYVIQRLITLSGQSVSITLPNEAKQNVKPQKDQVVFKAELFNKHFRHCNIFIECLLSFLNDLQSEKLVSPDEVRGFKAWISALQGIGYTFPSFRKLPTRCSRQQPVLLPEVSKSPPHRTNELFDFYRRTCTNSQLKSLKPWHEWQELVLVVIFNGDHTESIPFVETLYRPFFPRIFYCGPAGTSTNYSVTYLTYSDAPQGHAFGAFNYECLIRIAAISSPAKGFFFMGDDVIVFPHDVAQMDLFHSAAPSNAIADVVKGRECRLGMCDFRTRWHWWEDYRNSTLQAFSSLYSSHDPVLRGCARSLQTVTGGPYRALGGNTDFYYVPSTLVEPLLPVFHHFLRHKVFLEIAVPTSIHCVSYKVNVLKGKLDWTETRDEPWLHFDLASLRGVAFMHPVKWGYAARGDIDFRDFYCDKVLPLIYNPYGPIKQA